MGFLDGLFETKTAKDQQKASSAGAVGRAVSQSSGRYGMWSSVGNWDVDKAITEAYERDLWVYRCCDAIATNQSRIPILHRSGDARTGTILRSPRFHTLFNVRPNIYEDAQQFRYRLSVIALLSRKGYFIELVGDPRNPESMHLLPPQSVEPVPHPRKFVEGYWVIGEGLSRTWLEPQQVIWGKIKPHPTDPYQQMTPLVAAGLSVETDILARLFNRNFLNNDGRPGLLITVRGQMDPNDAEELKRRFGGGPTGAGQTTVIEGEGMDVADLGATPRDAQWGESIAASKSDILQAFGVPESVIGDASGRTFDNADAEYENFWIHTMQPHCDAIASSFDILTGDQYDGTVFAFDYNTVDVLQRQERRRQDAIIDRYLKGVITWNEMRKDIGYEVWDEPLAARIIVMASGIAFAKTGADIAGIPDLPQVGAGANPADAMSQIAQRGAEIGARRGARQLGNVLAARALMLAGKSAEELVIEGADADPFSTKQDHQVVDAVLVAPYETDRKEAEARLDGLLLGMSSRQAKIVSDRLTHAKALQGTRHWVHKDGEQKAKPRRNLDPFYAVEVERWVAEVRDDFERALEPLLRKEARRVVADMDRSSLAKVSIPDQRSIVSQQITELLDNIVEKSVRNQSNRIADRIAKMDEDGSSIEDIKSEVSKLISTRGSWRKALTGHVTGSGLEGVKHDLYATAGKRLKKTWNTEDDEKVRHSHAFNEGVTIKSDQMFEVGSTLMPYPNWSFAPIEETANCRCWLTYSL